MTIANSQKITAWEDITAAVNNFHLAALLGWQDVAQRYRRSSVGAFWLTINMGVLIGALGLIFGTIFRSPMSEFLPFICVGLIMWGYFSQLINEGCLSQNKANERLHDLVNKTKILIIASHSRQLLLANCSRIVWLEHGKVKID